MKSNSKSKKKERYEILVINAGSSSLKYRIFSATKKNKSNTELTCLDKGLIDRIGLPNGPKNHNEALKTALNIIIKKGIIEKITDIEAVGHRVVHGGEHYTKPTRITPEVIKTIKELCKLAPLHNPPNLETILACKKLLPKIPQVAVFDTAFHQTMPGKAFLYALPYSFYKKDGIRRYGFHGTSHSYIGREAAKLLGARKDKKIITCHLGNGSSITAIKNGESMDTSMGFTPLEGIPMGTRCGDIDPAIVYKIMETHKLNTKQIDELLNKESGLKGLYQKSPDMRDIWASAQKKEKRALFLLDFLAYKIAKYIASYTVALDGLDAITFTGGIGENAYYLRARVIKLLNPLGAKIDTAKNKKNALQIHSPKSKIKIFIIPTNEELEIARETLKLVK